MSAHPQDLLDKLAENGVQVENPVIAGVIDSSTVLQGETSNLLNQIVNSVQLGSEFEQASSIDQSREAFLDMVHAPDELEV